jgi:uncharacterized protein (DUF608 family)
MPPPLPAGFDANSARVTGAAAISAAEAENASALIVGTVPLGGAGAGSVEVAADARMRHISINNNRNPAEWIPSSPNSFMALRFAQEGQKPLLYILQRDSRTQNTGLVPLPRIPKSAFSSKGIFPLLHFFAHSRELPFSAVWMHFSPMVPFDLEASVLPLILSSAVIRNRTEAPAEVSLMFHLEHLCGRKGEDALIARPISGRYIEEEERAVMGHEEIPAHMHNALLFESDHRQSESSATHCIAVRSGKHPVSVGAYNASEPLRCNEFWEHFAATGKVPTGLVGGEAEFGAVCVEFTLPPKEERQADFVWSWHAPAYTAGEETVRNGYTTLVRDAVDGAQRGLRFGGYYHRAVSSWQQRLHASTMPHWLVKELINSARIFTRNGLYADDGRFGLQASPLDTRVGEIASRLYGSFGTLLFLPRFEEEELSLALRAREPGAPDLLCHSLGKASLHNPQAGSESDQMQIAAHLVVSSYRNYLFSGSMVHARKRFAMLRAIMHAVAELDFDRDGFPEGREANGALRLNASTCGLWLLAVRCYIHLARDRDAEDEALMAEQLHQRAKENFERYFWREELGAYALWREGHEPEDESAPQIRFHLGQLAGEWYSAVLGLGPQHDPQRVERTLDVIAAQFEEDLQNLTPNMFADTDALNRVMAHAGCLLIYRDRVELGLKLISWLLQSCEKVHGAARRQRSSSLAVWHVLHAVHGTTLVMPRQQLRVIPHLPPNIQFMATPVFTPAGLCWLKYKVETGQGHRQRFHIQFDSPANILSVLMRVPEETMRVRALCEVPDGPLPCRVEILPGSGERFVLITLEREQYVSSAFSVDLLAE